MLDPARYQAIAIDKRPNGVVVATLNRPERLNAVNATLHHELSTVARDFDEDPDTRAMVITGAGRAFCAGGDFSPGAFDSGSSSMFIEGREIVDNLLACQKPVISAVNGYAMGLGATVALLCDVVYAGRSAVFADTHVKMGIGAGDGGQVIWPFLIGVNRAKFFLMTGDRVTADEADRLGLVQEVVDDDKLMGTALALAERLATGPAKAIAASKAALNNYLRTVSAMILPLSLQHEAASMRSEDHHEAVRAFQEKREPRYTGR